MKRFIFSFGVLIMLSAALLHAQDSVKLGVGRLGSGVHGFNGVNWDAIRGTKTTGLAVVTPLVTTSEMTSQAFVKAVVQVSPGTNLDLLNVWSGSSKRLYFDRALFSTTSTSAVEVAIYLTVTAGTTCTTFTPNSLVIGFIGSDATAAHTCSGDPGINTLFMRVGIPPGGTVQVDLAGVITPSSLSGFGVSFVNSLVATGNVSTSVLWYEK
jgi:hypothetical protein